jgi:hypothetical protein
MAMIRHPSAHQGEAARTRPTFSECDIIATAARVHSFPDHPTITAAMKRAIASVEDNK